MDLTQFDNPLTAAFLGLFFGLFIALYVAIRGWFAARKLKKDNASLLRSHVLLHEAGNKAMSAELAKLKQENENLRITVTSLKMETGKAELRTLHVYDDAIRLMNARAPGFAPAWESALAEAEMSMAHADTGVVAWIKRTIRPSLGNRAQPSLSGSATPSLPEAQANTSDMAGKL